MNDKGLNVFLTIRRTCHKWLDRNRQIDVPLSPGYVFCLAGLRGIVLREKNDYKVVVRIDLLHRSIAVEIDYQDLLPGLAAGS